MNGLEFSAFESMLDNAAKRRLIRADAVRDAVENGMVMWGYGWKGRALSAFARQCGFAVSVYDVDPNSRAAAERDGFRTLSDKPSAGPIVLGATQVQSELAKQLGERAIFFQEVAYHLNMPVLANHTREYADFVSENPRSVFDVYAKLKGVSAERYKNLVTFRVSCDARDLSDSNSHVSTMWFDEGLLSKKDSIHKFLDVGAFDGDTIRSARRFLGIDEAIGLEISADLINSMVELHDGTFKLRPLNVGAWNVKCFMREAAVGDGMMTLEAGEYGSVACDLIDNIVLSKIDFIKMDIEGAEHQALEGAQRVISTYRPCLAVAAYHKPRDIVEIFSSLEKYQYQDVRFAHYSQCNDDSIFYFLR